MAALAGGAGHVTSIDSSGPALERARSHVAINGFDQNRAGFMDADVNVSLRPSPEAPLGTRTETKNVNSLKSVEAALRYEMRRQGALLADGGRVKQETRHSIRTLGGEDGCGAGRFVAVSRLAARPRGLATGPTCTKVA